MYFYYLPRSEWAPRFHAGKSHQRKARAKHAQSTRINVSPNWRSRGRASKFEVPKQRGSLPFASRRSTAEAPSISCCPSAIFKASGVAPGINGWRSSGFGCRNETSPACVWQLSEDVFDLPRQAEQHVSGFAAVGVAILSNPHKCRIGFTKSHYKHPNQDSSADVLDAQKGGLCDLVPQHLYFHKLGLALQEAEVMGLLCWPTCTTIPLPSLKINMDLAPENWASIPDLGLHSALKIQGIQGFFGPFKTSCFPMFSWPYQWDTQDPKMQILYHVPSICWAQIPLT